MKMTDKHGTFHLYVGISWNMVKDKAYDPQVYAKKHQLKLTAHSWRTELGESVSLIQKSVYDEV